MVFSSLTFLCIFLPVLLIVYYLVRPVKIRNGILVLASLLFYAFGEPVYILLMVISMVVNYFLGRALAQRKKSILVLAVVLNLGALGVFKYAGWIAGMISDAGNLGWPELKLSLPIGISFYTFQALSYLIDVYRGRCSVQKNPLYFFLYISFFPQLIAGPIVKYHDIENQIGNRAMDAEHVASGLQRFLVGLGKKVLIANVMAHAADTVFAMTAAGMGMAAAWTGAVAYLLQIYFDFSGYSDMAIGLGRMFGFRFLENFQYPYAADSIKEFWHRWHISLSTWFKEYLYIPLGGNRKGRIRTCVNKIIVFFCTGLWHGANLTFVVWGLFHGAFLLLEDFVPVRKVPKVLRHIYTVLVVCIGFVIFRADNMSQACLMIGKMFGGYQAAAAPLAEIAAVWTPLFIFVLILAVFGSSPVWRIFFRKWEGTPALTVISYVYSALILVLCLLYLSGGGYNPFIYFRF